MIFRKAKKTKKRSEKLSKLYEEYFQKIYKFFYYKVLLKEVAEDLTSETFMVLAEKIEYEEKIENDRAYIYGIARIVFVKYLQRKYKEFTLDLSDKDYLLKDEKFLRYAESFVEDIEEKETSEERILPYIDKLPEKQKIVIQMRLIEKYRLKEICEKLGKNMNYVKTTQKRGLKRLKELVATE